MIWHIEAGFGDEIFTFIFQSIFLIWFKFHWNSFPVWNWQFTSIGLGDGAAPITQQAIIWTSDGLLYSLLYAALTRLMNMVDGDKKGHWQWWIKKS